MQEGEVDTQYSPTSPNFSPCDFSIWGHVNNHVFISPLPTKLHDLKGMIAIELISIDGINLQKVLDEFSYHLDVIHASSGGYRNHL